MVAGLALMVTTSVRAQIGVELRMEQTHFLPTEAIEISVRITNHTGQTLTLGETADWLTFNLETPEGRVLPKLQDPDVLGKFTLESSKVATRRVNIAPCFPLETAGRYQVVANVNVKEWNLHQTSAPRSINIIEGTRLWQQEVGVPQSSGQLEVRRYVLQQANYIQSQIRLYLRITDVTGGKTFKVVPIGKVLSFSRPEGQVDSESNLHVLYQNGPHSFSYTKYNPNGELLIRQTYDYGTTRPRLQAGRDSKIVVQGGSRWVQATDIPTPTPEELNPPTPVTTNSTNQAVSKKS